MVSIIVPVYNAEKYLEECVNSILKQSCQDFELVLVNDGSSDRSGEICNTYKNMDSRIQVLSQPNGGVSSARNKGLLFSSGRYITFIDADDYVEPDYLELLLKNMSQGGMSACKVCRTEEGTYSEQRETLTPLQAQISCFSAYGMGGYVCGKLYDARIIKDNEITFDIDLAICEDLLFTIKYLQRSTSETVWDYSTLYHYRLNPAGAVNGRYSKTHIFNGKEITEIVALDRCSSYLILNDKNVELAYRMRTVKAAANTLRTMASNSIDNKNERRRLLTLVRKNIIAILKSKYLAHSSKFSILLAAISPKLELWIRRRYI